MLRLTPGPSVPGPGRMLRWGWGGWHRHDEREPPQSSPPGRASDRGGRGGLASEVPHAALPAAVHELEDPPVLGPDALPRRVARRVEVAQVPETARPRLTASASAAQPYSQNESQHVLKSQLLRIPKTLLTSKAFVNPYSLIFSSK